VEAAQRFYDGVKDSVTSKRLIVDLRNNGGGGYKASGNFITMLQKYAMNGGKIYIMVNNRTMSDAERFTIRLKGFDNVKVFGENTNGTIAYGNNTGRSDTLQSRKYRLYITDMPDQRNYVEYEDIGFTPDVLLNPDKEWISQTLAFIKTEK
jgi:C-terminal processing protease CtpA/Prc